MDYWLIIDRLLIIPAELDEDMRGSWRDPREVLAALLYGLLAPFVTEALGALGYSDHHWAIMSQ